MMYCKADVTVRVSALQVAPKSKPAGTSVRALLAPPFEALDSECMYSARPKPQSMTLILGVRQLVSCLGSLAARSHRYVRAQLRLANKCRDSQVEVRSTRQRSICHHMQECALLLGWLAAASTVSSVWRLAIKRDAATCIGLKASDGAAVIVAASPLPFLSGLQHRQRR